MELCRGVLKVAIDLIDVGRRLHNIFTELYVNRRLPREIDTIRQQDAIYLVRVMMAKASYEFCLLAVLIGTSFEIWYVNATRL